MVRAALSCDEQGIRYGPTMAFFPAACRAKQHGARACAIGLLVVSVLLTFDPPIVLVYVDAKDDVNGVADMVARVACPYLRAEGVPLPVPFEVRWLRKAGESQRYVPDPGRRLPGLLTVCPEPSPVSTDSRGTAQ